MADTMTLSTKRGDTFAQSFRWTQPNPDYVDPPVDLDIPERIPINLTGCTARLQFRKDRDDPPLLSFSTDDPELWIDPLEGIVYLEVPADTMAALAATTYKSDLEITYPDGTVCSTATFNIKVVEDQTV